CLGIPPGSVPLNAGLPHHVGECPDPLGVASEQHYEISRHLIRAESYWHADRRVARLVPDLLLEGTGDPLGYRGRGGEIVLTCNVAEGLAPPVAAEEAVKVGERRLLGWTRLATFSPDLPDDATGAGHCNEAEVQ